MSRRVLTKITIEELLAGGRKELQLEPGDIVTALAKEYAQERGLRLVPAGQRTCGAAAPATGQVGADSVQPVALDAAEVRRAVIAAIGHEPDGLDAIIARVMK